MEVGVIIGRFQVPEIHDGHRWLIATALRNHRKVVVFIGVAARVYSKDNPLDYQTRERMIRLEFPEVVVMPLMDRATDEEWSKRLDEQIEIVTNKTGTALLYGGRGSFIPHYKGKFKTAEVDSGMEGKSGSTLRIETGRVVRPTSDFRAGQIYFSQNAPVRPIVGVDVALVRATDDDWDILLGRKDWDAPNTWRLPGGKIEAKDDAFEEAASRELKEETGVYMPPGSMKYLSSAIISDWRDHGHKDLTYFSSLFVAELDGFRDATLKANDDLVEVKWFALETAHIIGVPKHNEMIQSVQSHFKWLKFKKDTK